MIPAGPEPTTITSHWVEVTERGWIGEANTKARAWRKIREDKKAAIRKVGDLDYGIKLGGYSNEE